VPYNDGIEEVVVSIVVITIFSSRAGGYSQSPVFDIDSLLISALKAITPCRFKSYLGLFILNF
jgi:hypothetical protein